MSEQFAKLARNLENKTVLNKRRWFQQPMLFFLVLLIIIGTIVTISLAGNGNNQTATVVFALMTFTGLLYTLYASSSIGVFGRCIEMGKLTT